MPTKRKVRTRRRTSLSFDSLSFRETMAILCGWSPGDPAWRWSSWQEYMADYIVIRDEVLGLKWTFHPDDVPFAEKCYQLYGEAGPAPGEDVDAIEAAWNEEQLRSEAELESMLSFLE